MAENIVEEVMEATESIADGGASAAGTASNGLGMVMDALKNIATDTEYSNPVSSALSSVGGMFGSLLPGSLGELAQKIFKALADKIDKGYSPNADLREHELSMMAGGEVTQVTSEVADVVGMDPAMFNADLSAAAAMLRGERGAEAGTSNQVMDIGAAIGGSAQAYPVATATALQTYSDLGEAWLVEHGSEYPDAAENMAYVNNAMATYYYESVMTAEASGLKLTDADREALNGFRMYGVEMTYDEYVAEHQADAKQAGNEHVVRSDGSLEASTDLDLDDVKAAAVEAVHTGSFADFREDQTALDAWERSSKDAVEGIRSGDPASMGSAYMDRLAEMQAYNDAAVSAIMEKYADDPEGRLAAEAGLAIRMQAGMGPLFDAMKEDQEAYGCFSSEQIEQISNLEITGVTVSYGEYVPGAGLFPVQPSASADDAVYANALDPSDVSYQATAPNGSADGTHIGQGTQQKQAQAEPGKYHAMALRTLNSGAIKEEQKEIGGLGLG